MPLVRTNYWAKPIPQRCFDWSAWYDGDEPDDNGAQRVGYGATLTEAVTDLLNEHPPICVDCNGRGQTAGAECATCEGDGLRHNDDPLDPLTIIQGFPLNTE